MEFGPLQPDHAEALEGYERAWRHHLENPRLRVIKKDRLFVQEAPAEIRQGAILMARPKGLGLSKVWLRFGRVICMGQKVHGLELGSLVMYREQDGRYWGGKYNPVRVSEGHQLWDQIRMLYDYDILGVITDDATGRMAKFKMPGMLVPIEVEILNGKPELQGLMEVLDHNSGARGYVSINYLEFDDPKPQHITTTIYTEVKHGQFDNQRGR